MIVCVVISDRGDLYLPGCLDNLADMLHPSVPIRLVDDRKHQLGLAGAARAAWDLAVTEGWTHLLHMEEDFRFVDKVPLESMTAVLDTDPTVAQVVMKRQPWSQEEVQAGGIIELHPDDYADTTVGGVPVVTHRRIFSLNPCLIPRWVLELGWPDSNEAGMTYRLTEDPAVKFAIYGAKTDEPRVVHVGAQRGAGWAL